MYEEIFKSIKIRNLEIKNRVVFAPTSLGNDRKKSTDKLIRIAKNDVGLIVIGDISVRSSFNKVMPTLDKDENIEYFKMLIDKLHSYGCKVSAQLFYPEYDVEYVFSLINEGKLDRNEIRALLKNNTKAYINEMSKEHIIKIQNSFVDAAIRAKKCGFDMIQIHGDRLLGSFSSSIFNKRKDEYGGESENRARMSGEIIRKIRTVLPEMPIDYKIGIRKENPDIGKGGPTINEVKTFVSVLDKDGVDSFHVTIANHSTIKDTIPSDNHLYLKGEGCFLDLAAEVKKYTNKIVCGVGKLKTPYFVNDVLKENMVDMVGLSRQFIADEEWVLKIKEENEEAINYCMFCNYCTNCLLNNKYFKCISDKSN